MASFGVTQTELAAEAATRAAADLALDARVDTLEAADAVTQAELDTHTADTTAVHGIADTSKVALWSAGNPADTVISAQTGEPVVAGSGSTDAVDVDFTPVGTIAATNVQAAVAEVASEAATATGTVATDLANHLADTVDAHDASAVSFAPTGTIAATDTQAAVAEVASEAASNLTAGLATKANTSHTHPQSDITSLTSDLALKAPLASPTFTGSPAAPTQTARDGSTKLATTAYVDAADQALAVNTQTISYTLVLTDAGKVVELNSASATVLTIPANSTVAFPVGTVIEIARVGAGSVTLTPAGGVTIRNRLEAAGTTSRTITSQYGSASLRKRATDDWMLVGELT